MRSAVVPKQLGSLAPPAASARLPEALARLKQLTPNAVTGIDLKKLLLAAGATGPEYDDFDKTFSTSWSTFVDGVEAYRQSGAEMVRDFHALATFLYPLEANKEAYRAARKGIRKAFEDYYAIAYSASEAAQARAALMTKVNSSLQTLRRQESRVVALRQGV